MYPLLVALLGCSSPADPGVPLFPDDQPVTGPMALDQAPPPPTMTLEVNNLYGGDFAALHITGATPGALLRIAHARSLGDGPCPPILGGLCLDLAPPVRLSNTATIADAAGSAWFAFRVPSGRADAIALQIAVTGGSPAVSNPVYRLVGPHNGAGGTDQDLDSDGFTPDAGDCADFEPAYHPDATDLVGDGADQNCDDADGVDDDRDAWPSLASGGADCDDLDADVSPEALEVCNAVDDDCDGLSDPDGTCADCDLPWGDTIPHGDSVTAYAAATVPYNGSCAGVTRTCDDGTLTGSGAFPTCSVTPALDCTLPWGGTLTHGSSVTAYAAATVPYGGTCAGVTRTCTNGALSGSGTFPSCSVLPPADEYMGCYHDNAGGVRDLSYSVGSNGANTVTSCITTCRNLGYKFAGAQFGSECFCGNSYGSQGLASVQGRSCDRACPGNGAQTCGGTNANSVYSTFAPVPKTLIGCYRDNTSGVRDMPANQGTLSYNNVGLCTSRCRSLGYNYAGVQFGSACFCGNTAGSQGDSASGGVSCGMACPGAPAENCGGSNANGVYAVKEIVQQYVGCYADTSTGTRDLPYVVGTNTKSNPLWCASQCRAAGYTYAGVQFGNECYCGNSYGSLGTAASAGRSCNMACPGATGTTCGGNQTNDIYRVQ